MTSIAEKSALNFSSFRRLHGLALMACYGLAFHFSYSFSANWAGGQFYSLFYLAAGVRFAFLWHYGARWTPAVIATEFLVQLTTGVIALDGPDMVHQVLAVARSPLCYGLVVFGVRSVEQRRLLDLSAPPIPFAIAAVIAPLAGAIVSVNLDAIWPNRIQTHAELPNTAVATGFIVGDLLGVLLLAPALIWLPTVFHDKRIKTPLSIPRTIEAIVVLTIGWLLALVMIQDMGQDVFLMPVLLSTIWVGLRCGRGTAWVAIIIAAAIALPMSAEAMQTVTLLNVHISLATIAITGYLTGSFADAQDKARHDIARRDRILFQVERLKTLRAMSLAVIHELSQPLSTLAIESRHLDKISDHWQRHEAEIRQSITLIARNAAALAGMVKRLRQFGGRAVDEPSTLSIDAILANAVILMNAEKPQGMIQICQPEIKRSLLVLGQETELTQALLNILRNAVAASPDSSVSVAVESRKAEIVIAISNHTTASSGRYAGMGIGSIIARTILEAHAGRIVRSDINGLVCHEIFLPLRDVDDA